MKKSDLIYIMLGFSTMTVFGIPAASVAGIAFCFKKRLEFEEKATTKKIAARTKVQNLKKQQIRRKMKKPL